MAHKYVCAVTGQNLDTFAADFGKDIGLPRFANTGVFIKLEVTRVQDAACGGFDQQARGLWQRMRNWGELHLERAQVYCVRHRAHSDDLIDRLPGLEHFFGRNSGGEIACVDRCAQTAP